MRKMALWLLAGVLLLSLCACQRSPEARWQRRYDLGVRLLSEGHYQQAIEVFQAAVEIDPKRAEAYLGQADAHMGLSETDAALDCLDAGAEAADNPQALLEKRDELLQQAAESAYSNALEALAGGDPESAEAGFRKAVGYSGEYGGRIADALAQYAQKLFDSGDADGALEAYQMALEYAPQQESLYTGMSAIYEAAGDTARTLQILASGRLALGSDKLLDREITLREDLLEKENKKLSAEAASNQAFLTSKEGEPLPFPESAYGFLGSGMIYTKNGEPILIAAYSEQDKITLKRFSVETDGTILETELGTAINFGTFEKVNVMLFFNKETCSYCIAAESTIVGSYTGVAGFEAHLYQLDENTISEYGHWEWHTYINDWPELESIGKDMEDHNWPYMDWQYQLEFINENSSPYCQWLAKSKASVTGGETPRYYTVYQRLLSMDELQSFEESIHADGRKLTSEKVSELYEEGKTD